MNLTTLFGCKMWLHKHYNTLIQNKLSKNTTIFRQSLTMTLAMLLILGTVELNGQSCALPATPMVITGAGTNPDTLDVNSNTIVDTGDGPIIDISATTCATLAHTQAVQAGGLYGFILNQNYNYTFTLCPDATVTPIPTGAEFDLYEASPWAPGVGFASGVADANGCVNYTYTGCATEVLLAPFTHCLPNWDDYTLTIACSSCSITAVTHVGATADIATCMTGDVDVPVPVVSPDPTAVGTSCHNMVEYILCDVDGNPIAGQAGMVAVNDPAGVLNLTGLPLGSHTLKWYALSACDPMIRVDSATTNVIVDVIMACNDGLNITMGNGCWVQITPDMILEAPCPNDADFEISINGVVTDIISGLGTYQVSIEYLPTGISCWGEVTIEDKTAPACNIPLADQFANISCAETAPAALTSAFTDCTGVANESVSEQIIANCGDINTLTDGDGDLSNDLPFNMGGINIPLPTDPTDLAEFTAYMASPDFVLDYVIKRTYAASDLMGFNNNGTTCMQFIFVWKPINILPPVTPLVVECGTATDVTSLATANATYVPHYIGIDGSTALALSGDHATCGYSVIYEDVPLNNLCGNNVKFLRRWTVMEWCTGTFNLDDFTQTIETEDTTAPTFTTCPVAAATGGSFANPITLNTSSSNTNSCYYAGLLTSPTATDACSTGITYSANIYNSSASGTGTLVSSVPDLTVPVQLNTGDYVVQYIATDDCGNTASCSVYYNVTDDDVPVAVCIENTVVSLGNDGTVQVCAAVFNNGSYDNCGIVAMKVKRMDAATTVEFTNCVTFTCADIANNNNLVRFRVYDELGATCGEDDGRYNECMIEVEVQDKIAPSITCPAAITIECTQDYTDTAITGLATATDNCESLTPTSTDVANLNMCGVGTVTRTWTVTDAGGATATCTQTITIQDSNPFTAADVTVPADVTMACTGFELSNPPVSQTGDITISNNDCKVHGISGPTDERFDVTNSDDVKIIRTWSVLEWCSGTQVTVSQEIWLQDCVAPVCMGVTNKSFDLNTNNSTEVIITGADIDNGSTGQSSFGISLSGGTSAASVTLDCSNISYLDDLSTPGVVDPINNPVALDLHLLDAGGGVLSTCAATALVYDKTPPTFDCTGLSISATVVDGSAQIVQFTNIVSATGTLNNPTDNCDSFADLNITFSPTTITCGPGGTGNSGNVDITITDRSGNGTTCSIPYTVTCTSFRTVAGRIFNEENNDIENVEVELQGSTEPMENTGADGLYDFEGEDGNDYTVLPSKDINPLNGVTTYDIVLLSKHVLGIETLGSPYKLIAADVNNDGVITTFDAVLLRQMVLFILTDFPNNTSWRFVDANYSFPNPLNPWSAPFPENYDINNLTTNMLVDFVGVKVGDLDCSAAPNNALMQSEDRNDTDLAINVQDQDLAVGEEYTVALSLDELSNLEGMQFTLDFDTEKVSFVGLDFENQTAMTAVNIGLTKVDEGFITASWVNTGLETDALVNVIFRANETTKLSEAINLSSRYTAAEAYEEGGARLKPVLDFGNVTSIETYTNTGFELLQNQPNPFTSTTTIGFQLPKANKATLTIFDISGKVLKTINGTYQKGYNAVTIDRAMFSASGILYYQLSTEGFSATQKMIVID